MRQPAFRSVALVGSAVCAQVAVRRQIEQLVAAIALTDHRAGLWLEFETPFPFHGVAVRAFEINSTDRRDGDPGVTALDAESLAAAVRVLRWPWGELNDVAHADFQLPVVLRLPLFGLGLVMAKRFIMMP